MGKSIFGSLCWQALYKTSQMGQKRPALLLELSAHTANVFLVHGIDRQWLVERFGSRGHGG